MKYTSKKSLGKKFIWPFFWVCGEKANERTGLHKDFRYKQKERSNGIENISCGNFLFTFQIIYIVLMHTEMREEWFSLYRLVIYSHWFRCMRIFHPNSNRMIDNVCMWHLFIIIFIKIQKKKKIILLPSVLPIYVRHISKTVHRS